MATHKIDKVCFFTDEKGDNFHPLTLTRPLDDLRIGIYTIREKWMRTLGINRYARLIPEYLQGVFQKNEIDTDEQVLWINSRFLPSVKLTDEIRNLGNNQCLVFNETCVAAILDGEKSAQQFEEDNFTYQNLDLIKSEDLIHLEHLWDLLSLNAYEIEKDIALSAMKPVTEKGDAVKAEIIAPENVYVANDANIEPGVIMMADEGPVVVMEAATVEAGSILKGPVVIGKGATVKMGARISEGTTVGPICKVGGEIMNCIFHSYSNKAHDGFAGNSIFGQWVNLGADTNTSNLKNNYSTVRLTDWVSKEEFETGQQFLGTVMGDHSKTAINTMLNTGTMCGVSSNIFMKGFPPKYIPSFAWVGSEEYGEYAFDKAIEAMKAMMKRRGKEMTQSYRNMMKFISEQG